MFDFNMWQPFYEQETEKRLVKMMYGSLKLSDDIFFTSIETFPVKAVANFTSFYLAEQLSSAHF